VPKVNHIYRPQLVMVFINLIVTVGYFCRECQLAIGEWTQDLVNNRGMIGTTIPGMKPNNAMFLSFPHQEGAVMDPKKKVKRSWTISSTNNAVGVK
jgi:hypothetical protein